MHYRLTIRDRLTRLNAHGVVQLSTLLDTRRPGLGDVCRKAARCMAVVEGQDMLPHRLKFETMNDKDILDLEMDSFALLEVFEYV